MTPNDVAAIKAEAWKWSEPAKREEQVRALCDALEAAWAARDGNAAAWDSTAELLKLTLTRIDRLDDMLKQQVLVTEQRVEILRERAERAEAQLEIKAKKVLEQHAVLARVRALCDPAVLPHEASRLARNIRAAIEGGNQ